MQATSNNGRFPAGQASTAAVPDINNAGTARASAAQPHPYQPSQPHVLTEELKAQLAAANQQRRESLYPRLVQNLVVSEQSDPAHHPSQERAMSLQQLAAANRARRSRLREAGYALPQSMT